MSAETTTPTALLSVSRLKDYIEADRGRAFVSLLIARRVTHKTAANGNPFWSLELGDRSGSFRCTLFGDSPVCASLSPALEGSALRFEGKVDFYQGAFSPRPTHITPLSEAELAALPPDALDELIEKAPEEAAQLRAEFEDFIKKISHDELRMTLRQVFDAIGEAFYSCPAAIAMHHAYRHGLLEHTVHMARVARATLPLYPEVDPDLAMAGILVHDIGKVIEYEGTLAAHRSRRGVLQGHVVLGYQLVRRAGLKAGLDEDRLERLEHIVLSHQGAPEWGAAVYAATPEAVFVSMIDNLDARMGMVQRALRQASDQSEFSERIPGLNTTLLTAPIGGAPPTPSQRESLLTPKTG